MNSRFEVCSIVNSSSSSSGCRSATTTVTSGSAASPASSSTSPASDLTRNGAVNHWTYALSEQYQQNYYPQYQYQGFQYHQQSYYQGQIYQQQQAYYSQQQQHYFGQNSHAPPAHQQQNAVGAQQQGGEGGQCWVCGAAFQDVALLRDHLALFHAHVLIQTCHLCPAVFPSQPLLAHHFSTCHVVGVSGGSSRTQQLVTGHTATVAPHPYPIGTEIQKQERRKFISKSGESHKGEKVDLWCVHCRINQFASERDFEAHHLGHVRERTLKVRLVRLSAAALKKSKVESSRRRRGTGIKLKLKISKVGRGRGRKRREVRIVSNEGMSDGQNSQARKRLEAKTREQEEVDGTEEGTLPEEKVESGGESEGEQESSRSPIEPQDTEEQLEQDSSPGHDDLDSGKEQDYEQEEQDFQQDSSEQQEQDQEKEEAASSEQKETQEEYQEASASNNQSDNSNSGFGSGFGDQDLGFGGAGPSEAPSSTYQPQFESFPTSDWFSDYESGPRIAAAMAGATAAETASEGSAWAGRAEGAANTTSTYPTSDTPPEKDASSPPVNGGTSEGDGEDGLFSQAVLGQESPEKHDRQGSFEQLCLNDSFSGQNQDDSDDQSQQQQQDQSQLSSPQDQQQQAAGVTNDLLSELEYLNNSGQSSQSSQQDSQPGSQQGSQSGSQTGQLDGSPHSGGPSPHSGGPATPSHLSSRGSNSGTPTSSGGQPTPPPSDTSFRALATSPITSPTQEPASPSLHKGPTPPAVSPLQQQMQSQLSPQQAGEQQQQQQQAEVPRLTIANNLMAPTTSSHMMATTTASQAGVGGMMSRYGSQWSQGAGYSGTGSYASLAGTSMANTNLTSPLRAPLPPSVGMPYRPSPPPRVRGRPPLMGHHVGRPPLHQAAHLQPSRGPGRPPTSSILPPPLMPAPGGRGGMMPPLQRMHQTMYPGQRQTSPQQQNAAGKRQLLGAAGHSPSKTARREDINVPSRQKDNECQIIAVANRSDGLPVISNVQGGSAAPGSQQRGTGAPSTTESTINLSDSITLSVRASGSNKDAPARGERGGPEAGAVANLLASRGITVTPAAGERQDGSGGRDDRRLPTAQELNLSSAISVHPPTQREREAGGRERDRDGFAVPQAPASRGSSSNSSLERPPRPPTVDLTQDVPSSGAQGTRHKCHQCDRSFPTAALLADHSRVHQQQTQSRMPFKCHLCTAGFSTQKGQQHHYQQFHQIQLSAGDVAIPIVDLRNPVNVQRMAALGIRSFLPLTNLQNRGAGGVVGIPILTLENLRNGHMTLQQWGVSDVLSLGPAKTLNMPR